MIGKEPVIISGRDRDGKVSSVDCHDRCHCLHDGGEGRPSHPCRTIRHRQRSEEVPRKTPRDVAPMLVARSVRGSGIAPRKDLGGERAERSPRI